ncbi:MAG TPA: aldo/keto reductase, partial [Thermohalobaculum sp.]|nr:aldo/keto reductase [Thermohalobaculum sp.]
LGPVRPAAQTAAPLMRTIPSSGIELPAVGLGTWITFNVGNDPLLLDESVAVMAAFFEDGGLVIDSSPMYGSSQDTIGYGLEKLGHPPVFAADKVWMPGGAEGRAQAEASRRKWGVERFDLMQVHNLVDWQQHLDWLIERREAGEVGHVGVTTSHGRRHDELEEIMRSRRLDFVQLTYNIADREAEARLLPLAEDRDIAVIANRPFRRKALIHRFEGTPLPGWAAEIGAGSWAQVLLKFILSHPAITVAIPATTRVDHVRENLAAASGPLPDEAMRRRMVTTVQDL